MNTRDREELLRKLEDRFRKNERRHSGIAWAEVRSRLERNPAALDSVFRMESTGGEPDVIGGDPHTGEFIFCDCSRESPEGRRSTCYDDEALAARKENKPNASAMGMAREMGVEMLTESEYRKLQELGEFDSKTSSWVLTPDDIRTRGGALFCDRRYGHVFVYHNGAQSYFGARGFRGTLRV